MASRWNQNPRSNSRASSRAQTDGTPTSASMKRSPRPLSDHSSTRIQWSEPPPLDDNCARYILSVMVLFLRQTIPPDYTLMPSNRPAGNSYHGFESLELAIMSDLDDDETSPSSTTQDSSRKTLWNPPSSVSIKSGQSLQSTVPIPTHNLSYEKTPVTLVKVSLSLNTLIAKYAGIIIYHLSASNWPVVFNRLRNKIRHLAGHNCEENPDIVDLHLMTYSALDKGRLVQVLNGMLLVKLPRF
jgi:hypothetical protein